MNLRTRLSRSNGYRELGMFDESINQDDVWTYEVIKAKYLTYRDAKQFEMAEAMTKAMRIYHNNRTEGWLLRAECINETKGAKEAAEMLLEDEDSFKEQADVLFAIGRYLALAGNLNKAKDYIRRAIKLEGKYRSEFLEDPAFDPVWESF
jgi:predicted Zn-dependent protease